MNSVLQNTLALGLISLAAAVILAPVIRAFLNFIAHALLKRGRVKWAMRFRKWAEGR